MNGDREEKPVEWFDGTDDDDHRLLRSCSYAAVSCRQIATAAVAAIDVIRVEGSCFANQFV